MVASILNVYDINIINYMHEYNVLLITKTDHKTMSILLCPFYIKYAVISLYYMVNLNRSTLIMLSIT